MKICPNSELGDDKDQIIGFYENGLLNFLGTPVSIDEVFGGNKKHYRSINACETKSCYNWTGKKCNVPEKILTKIHQNFMHLAENCPIRKDCRWYHQDGLEICKKCPSINFQNETLTP
ncbi:hypothetical protein [Chryseobacterium shigense]|uniref:Uncharacterized protein n=1 Tax=Chryseobacterium shigense TaxID=297244 RepID=A0A841N2J2_9FLAO|nr:hypothetical protein [Chryseobacterium shigense]MBB6371356.1 hypothetical protein [Chryseobacterium shigense]